MRKKRDRLARRALSCACLAMMALCLTGCDSLIREALAGRLLGFGNHWYDYVVDFAAGFAASQVLSGLPGTNF